MITKDLNDMYYFVQVVDFAGFAPAGRALGVPKSKLSRRIAELELQLGVRLLQRSTRHFSVTELGQKFYLHCQAMLEQAEAAYQVVAEVKAEPSGVVRLTCPVGLLSFHVAKMLAEFMQLYPKIELHLESTNRQVDVMAEGVDLALRVRPLPLKDSELLVRMLSDRGQCVVAAPSLIETHGVIECPEDLTTYPALHRARPEESHVWYLSHANGTERRVAFEPRFITTDMHALKVAALAGVGVVQLPELMVLEELAAGALVKVLPEWEPQREVIHLVYASRRGVLPSVRALIDFLARKYEELSEN